MFETIKTKRLTITPYSEKQLEEKILSENDEHLKSAFSEMLETVKKSAKNKKLFCVLWSVSLKNGEEIGTAGFMGAPCNGTVEIGYGTNEEHRNNGYMTEAVGVLCKWAFEQCDVYFIDAQTESDNIASQRVLEKCGFKEIEPDETDISVSNKRFSLEKPDSCFMSIYMCVGMCLGLAVSEFIYKSSIGICFGMGIGVAVGTIMDTDGRKKREKFSEERKNKTVMRNKK